METLLLFQLLKIWVPFSSSRSSTCQASFSLSLCLFLSPSPPPHTLLGGRGKGRVDGNPFTPHGNVPIAPSRSTRARKRKGWGSWYTLLPAWAPFEQRTPTHAPLPPSPLPPSRTKCTAHILTPAPHQVSLLSLFSFQQSSSRSKHTTTPLPQDNARVMRTFNGPFSLWGSFHALAVEGPFPRHRPFVPAVIPLTGEGG